MFDWIDLPLIWTGLIGIAVFMYVFMDGFDLGVGILFPFARDEHDRDIMMNTVAPIWDGNETWLVLGGGGLLAAFPLAYAIIMEALYLPLLIMLLALIFRGVAFEFRFKSRRNKRLWTISFAAGSALATMAQGIVLGTFIQGFEVDLVSRTFAGSAWIWLSPFSLLCGVSLLLGYALLGATWLIMRTEGELQAWCFDIALPLGVAVVVAVIGVSAATPLVNDLVVARWFTWPNILYLTPVPLLVGVCGLVFWRAIEDRREYLPFLTSMALFALSYLGLGISMFPNIVPYDITLWQAASPDKSLRFMLVGISLLLPMILVYTFYTYWVFRGKVTTVDGYH